MSEQTSSTRGGVTFVDRFQQHVCRAADGRDDDDRQARRIALRADNLGRHADSIRIADTCAANLVHFNRLHRKNFGVLD